MVFSSHLFIFYFLPVVLLIYYASPPKARHLGLTLFSYLFYGWANPWFVILMLGTTAVDYAVGLWIAGAFGPHEIPLLPAGGPRTRSQKLALTVSMVSNLSLLGFFKYFNFGLDNYNSLVAALGLSSWHWDTALRVTLPLGISFYTFQSMSYTIDVYRGDARAVRSFIDFACFVSMFPQLVAGPIIRFSDVADQLQSRTHTVEKFARGVAMFSVGLSKKVLLANPCGKVADVVFSATPAGTLDSWYGLLAYAFQIYFDFSAYSDMAIGLGLMMGFMFAKNFDSPYQSASITEFWRRWHISLSTWLRDYLYLPLGGNRLGTARTYVNLAVVMLLGGLWHGAAWTFVIWGAIHGGMLVVERVRGKTSFYEKLPRPARVALTFALVNLAWVFFRSNDLPSALAFVGRLFGIGAAHSGAALIGGLLYTPYYVGCFILAAAVVWLAPQSWDWTRQLSWQRALSCAGLLWTSLSVMLTQSYNPFIYFIF
jgi:alginate O-acetyltransferase complex protein AlgI